VALEVAGRDVVADRVAEHRPEPGATAGSGRLTHHGHQLHLPIELTRLSVEHYRLVRAHYRGREFGKDHRAGWCGNSRLSTVVQIVQAHAHDLARALDRCDEGELVFGPTGRAGIRRFADTSTSVLI